MRITQIKALRGLRVFRNFQCSNDVPGFGDVNVIYGWNGSGKSTITSVFRSLELGEALASGDARLQLEGGKVLRGDQFTANAPFPVRVFDQDYVRRTVAKATTKVDHIDHIYLLGEESIEKQRELEQRRGERDEAQAQLILAEGEIGRLERDADREDTDAARDIKTSLGRLREFANYDRRRLRTTLDRLAGADEAPPPLTDTERDRLLLRADSKPMPPVPALTRPTIDWAGLEGQVVDALADTLVGRVTRLTPASDAIRAWLRVGVGLHAHAEEPPECLFCGSPLTAGRMSALQALFDDADTAFGARLDGIERELKHAIEQLQTTDYPVKASVFPDLQSDLEEVVSDVKAAVLDAVLLLRMMLADVTKKQTSRSRPLSPTFDATRRTAIADGLEAAFSKINVLLTAHNTRGQDLERTRRDAAQALEDGLAVRCLAVHKERRSRTDTLAKTTAALKGTITASTTKINKLEADIRNYVRPVQDLNAALARYLGRNELEFHHDPSGYRLTRRGEPAEHLSEGEKTAIAFLYFLATLRDDRFKQADGIVVVDDPVTSMDSNNIFAAYSFLKSAIKNGGQWFILTHSFPFYRQLRNLKPTQYVLRTAPDPTTGERSASIAKAPSALTGFESDYHYCFDRVVAAASAEGGAGPALESYEMPNVARRLLEKFLSFRYPAKTKLLSGLLEDADKGGLPQSDLDLLERFLNVFSHGDVVPDEAHDPIALGETPLVLQATLRTLKALDPTHYAGMLKAVARPCPIAPPPSAGTTS